MKSKNMMKNKSLKTIISLTCACSMLTPMNTFAVEDQIESEDGTVDIYPQPQEMNYLSKEGMTLDKNINLVVHGNQNENTINKLKSILEENEMNVTESNILDSTKSNIFISSNKDHCEDCNSDDVALDEVQGYTLVSSNDENEKGNIEIIASDEEGAYYGVLTLEQMLE